MLPSTSSHEIFLESHAGKFTVMLPKEIQLDQKLHWEMALVELFSPKQDSVAVIENLWYETQGPNRRWKRTYVPSSAFLSVTSLFDYLRKIFKGKIDIMYDEYKQIVIWKMKDMNSNLFKVRLSNHLAKSMAWMLLTMNAQRLQRFGRKVHVVTLIILNTTWRLYSIQVNL